MESVLAIEKLIFSFLLTSAVFDWAHQGRQEYATMRHSNYDFVIVGGGTGGLVLANRLTENPNFNVLVLDSGGAGNLYTHIPYSHSQITSSNTSTTFQTEPQEFVCKDNEQQGRCRLEIGNVFGGRAMANALTYVRGSPLDYDEWEKGGATGWSYKDVLPYFRKSENMLDKKLVDSETHSTGGPLDVTVEHLSPYSEAWLEAGRELGHRVGDFNSDNPNGFSLHQLTVSNGQVGSSQRYFLDPVKHRKNLDVLCFAPVHRIKLIGNEAVGVEFKHQGAKHTVYPEKEIILSAGPLTTPKLLMLSGVGPKEQLNQLNIPVKADLPVGQALQDHLYVSLRYKMPTNPISPVNYQDYNEYIQNKTGKLSKTFKLGIAMITGLGTADAKDTQIQYSMSITKAAGEEQNYFTVFVILNNPKSKGWLKLNSSKFEDNPIIDPKYLSFEEDRDILRWGVKQFADVANTKAIKELNLTFADDPNCAGIEPKFDDDHVDCLIGHSSYSYGHYTSTARMGKAADGNSVVDPELKVHGLNGIRVVDTSVMPKIPRGGAFAPVIMIAERASDFIKSTWK